MVTANTSQFSTQSFNDGEPSILVTPFIIEDPLWYPDSGASHHMTYDPTLFTDNQEYQGSANVKLGNGAGMTISHIGSTSCVSLVTNIVISLQNLLHVPTLNKNMLSVSNFAKEPLLTLLITHPLNLENLLCSCGTTDLDISVLM